MLLRRSISKALGGSRVSEYMSTDLWTGNQLERDITNDKDYVADDWFTWVKVRSDAADHWLFDTVRGPLMQIRPSGAFSSSSLANSLTSFNSDGYSLGTGTHLNQTSRTYVGWSFKKAEKFASVITYTGNGVPNRKIEHELGIQAGQCFVKCLTMTPSWETQHISRGGTVAMHLDSVAIDAVTTNWGSTTMDATYVTVGTGLAVNQNGEEYLMLVFAHDPSPTGAIRCGEYTGTGVADGSLKVALGWKPQYLIIKRASAGGGSWIIIDTTRGEAFYLRADDTAAEVSSTLVTFTDEGFEIVSSSTEVNANGSDYTYMAIREENI